MCTSSTWGRQSPNRPLARQQTATRATQRRPNGSKKCEAKAACGRQAVHTALSWSHLQRDDLVLAVDVSRVIVVQDGARLVDRVARQHLLGGARRAAASTGLGRVGVGARAAAAAAAAALAATVATLVVVLGAVKVLLGARLVPRLATFLAAALAVVVAACVCAQADAVARVMPVGCIVTWLQAGDVVRLVVCTRLARVLAWQGVCSRCR
eukprot:352015-Chlamydomonas_euryale.AAC.2